MVLNTMHNDISSSGYFPPLTTVLYYDFRHLIFYKFIAYWNTFSTLIIIIGTTTASLISTCCGHLGRRKFVSSSWKIIKDEGGTTEDKLWDQYVC